MHLCLSVTKFLFSLDEKCNTNTNETEIITNIFTMSFLFFEKIHRKCCNVYFYRIIWNFYQIVCLEIKWIGGKRLGLVYNQQVDVRLYWPWWFNDGGNSCALFFKTITCQFIILYTFSSQMAQRRRWNRVNIRF